MLTLAACSNSSSSSADGEGEDIIDELLNEAEKTIELEKDIRIELPDRKKLEEKQKKLAEGICDDPRDCFIEGRRALLDGKREKGLAMLDEACNREVIESCRRLGKIFKQGELALKEDEAEDLERAKGYLERAEAITREGCEEGKAMRCVELGNMYTAGDGVPRDRLIAKAFFNRACDLGHAPGCLALGNTWIDKHVSFRDPSKAASSFIKACDLEEADAKRCSDLGRMLSERVPGQRAIALPLVEKACDEGKAFACVTMAEFLMAGLSIERDEARAKKLRESACNDNKRGACYSLGLMYKSGALVPQDASETLRLFQIACSAGEREACKKAKDFLKVAGDPEEKERRAKLEEACKAQGGPACHKLGQDLLPGGGRTPDQRRAFQLFQKTCDSGYVPSCEQLAEMYELGVGVLRDFPSALETYRSACKRGSGEACLMLSRINRQIGRASCRERV